MATLAVRGGIKARRSDSRMLIGQDSAGLKILDKVLQMALPRRFILLIRPTLALDTSFRGGIDARQIGFQTVAASLGLAGAF